MNPQATARQPGGVREIFGQPAPLPWIPGAKTRLLSSDVTNPSTNRKCFHIKQPLDLASLDSGVVSVLPFKKSQAVRQVDSRQLWPTLGVHKFTVRHGRIFFGFGFGSGQPSLLSPGKFGLGWTSELQGIPISWPISLEKWWKMLTWEKLDNRDKPLHFGGHKS